MIDPGSNLVLDFRLTKISQWRLAIIPFCNFNGKNKISNGILKGKYTNLPFIIIETRIVFGPDTIGGFFLSDQKQIGSVEKILRPP